MAITLTLRSLETSPSDVGLTSQTTNTAVNIILYVNQEPVSTWIPLMPFGKFIQVTFYYPKQNPELTTGTYISSVTPTITPV